VRKRVKCAKPVFHFFDDSVLLRGQAALVDGHAQQLVQQVLRLVQFDVLKRETGSLQQL
jgi:hypothetical protein